MPKHLSSYYEKEEEKKKKAKQHMDSLNESEISGLTLPVALRCPPKPPPQNLLKYARRSSSAHKESKDENNNGSTASSADETAGSKIGRDIDINTNYTSQLSELSSPTTVPPLLVEALVERYRHLSSPHTTTKKKRQSQPLPTMREKMSKMTMEMSSFSHSHPPRDHVRSSSSSSGSKSSSSREVMKDSTSYPTRDHANSSNRSSEVVLPTPPPPPSRNSLPGPPFAKHRYPHNTNDPSSSSSRGWSSPQDLKPLINDKKNHQSSRIKKIQRATTRQPPMECETRMYQSHDNNNVGRKG
jgi:hypothetical protein